MSNDLIAAAETLAGVLERENVALRALDFSAATQLTEDKARALAALMARHADNRQTTPDRSRALVTIRARLEGLTIENQRLLATALQVQGRVMAVIARAAARDAARQAPGYDASGGYGTGGAATTRPAPIAISARA